MNDRRHELDQRLLEEARARADGRVLRRFLILLAVAVLFGAYGIQSNAPLALGIALVCVAVAIYSIRAAS